MMLPLKKIFKKIFLPKFYSSLKQQDQLFAYSKKQKVEKSANCLSLNNSIFGEMNVGKNLFLKKLPI